MRTPKEYSDNLDKGIVTKTMLCDVLYSYNKRAKNWRDKKRNYKHSYSLNSFIWFNNALENEQKFYHYKDELLSLIEPTCIHEETLENDYEMLIHYYLFYDLGGHSFHHPIDKEELVKYPNLKVVKIEPLETTGTSAAYLLSAQFCDKVREALLNGEANIVQNEEQENLNSNIDG